MISHGNLRRLTHSVPKRWWSHSKLKKITVANIAICLYFRTKYQVARLNGRLLLCSMCHRALRRDTVDRPRVGLVTLALDITTQQSCLGQD